MANELTIHYATGQTLYALLFNNVGLVWNGTIFEAPLAANWATYDLPMTEVAATSFYRASMPSVGASQYSFDVRIQAGVNPATTDLTAGVGSITWDGSAVVSWASLAGKIVAAMLSLACINEALREIDLYLRRGDTWIQIITGLGDISTRTGLWITCKSDKDDADTASAFLIEETAGLEYINGTAAGAPANGSITVDNALSGAITVRLEAVETAKLGATARRYYDVQWTDGTDVTTVRRGFLFVTSDVTRAVS